MSKTFKRNVIAHYRGFDIFKEGGRYGWESGNSFPTLREAKDDIDKSIDVGIHFKPKRVERLSRRRFDDVEYASW